MASQKKHDSNDFDPVERFNKRTKCSNQQQSFLPPMQHNISQQQMFTSPPSTPQLRSPQYTTQHNISEQQLFTSPPSTPQLRSPQYTTQTAPNPNVDVDEEGSECGYNDDFINNYVTESLNIARKLKEQANRENMQQQTDSGFNPPPPPDDQTTPSSFSPEIFIELVRQYPCIWNVKLNVYKDNTKKKIAWAQIKDILGGFHTGELF